MSQHVPPDLSAMLRHVEAHIAQTYGRWVPDDLRAMVASIRGVFSDPDYEVLVRLRANPVASSLESGSLASLVARLHAHGGISHAIFCAKFSHSDDSTESPTAFPCDCGLEEIFRHITVSHD